VLKLIHQHSLADPSVTPRQKSVDEEDTTAADVSQELVNTLPKLFTKYQSDSGRMVEVLRLASHIDFQTYSEHRLVPVSSRTRLCTCGLD
jgi:hypothetical protein